MAQAMSTTIHKLQQAINGKGERILYHKTQWYSDKEDRPITVYKVMKSIYDTKKGKSTTIELFSAYSQIQIILFLRDYWYELNGWEVPTDNETWNKAKESYFKKKEQVIDGQKG